MKFSFLSAKYNHLLTRFLAFAAVSGIGWLIDMLLFALLLSQNTPVFLAACLSPLFAITWVFFFSSWKLFYYHGHFLWLRFGAYIAYSTLQLLVFAKIIQYFASLLDTTPLLIKLAVTPITLLCNFVAMSYVLHTQQQHPHPSRRKDPT